MLKPKQTTTLDYVSRYRIKDIKINGDIVTLVRGDNISFSFNTKGISGTKGDTGPKGDTGERGESAYDIAVRTGKTTADLETWLKSFKGPKGPSGANGTNGVNGLNGKDGVLPQISMSPVTWLPYGTKPYVTVNNEENVCTITLGIPVGKTGKKGADSNKPDITTGTYTVGKAGSDAAVSLVDNKLSVTVPAGDRGSKGTDSTGTIAYAPFLDIKVDYCDHDEEPSVSYSGDSAKGQPWTKTITVKVPRGETGDKGIRGEQGDSKPVSAPATFKIITDEAEVQDPGQGFSVISVNKLGGFSGKAYGWCWRTADITLQVVRFINKPNGYYTGWWYRTGPATGQVSTDIRTGWKRRQ